MTELKNSRKESQSPNPDRLDIAPDFRAWSRRLIRLRCHVCNAAIITGVIGVLLALLESSLFLRIAGIVLVALGVAIIVDQGAHLFSN